MNELIKIRKTNSGSKAVSAKELYIFLGHAQTQWKRWSDKNIINNEYALEGHDYQTFDIMSKGNPTKDFALSIDFAKKLSMMAKTEKGEEVRNYFIEIEKQAMAPALPQSFPEALRLLADSTERETKALEQLAQSNHVIQENKPKVVFANSVIGSSNSILIRQFAKDMSDDGFKIGQNRLFGWFRENKYLQRNNEPYQQYVDQGLFEVKTRVIGSGEETFTTKTTKITGKGSVYFANKLKEN